MLHGEGVLDLFQLADGGEIARLVAHVVLSRHRLHDEGVLSPRLAHPVKVLKKLSRAPASLNVRAPLNCARSVTPLRMAIFSQIVHWLLASLGAGEVRTFQRRFAGL